MPLHLTNAKRKGWKRRPVFAIYSAKCRTAHSLEGCGSLEYCQTVYVSSQNCTQTVANRGSTGAGLIGHRFKSLNKNPWNSCSGKCIITNKSWKNLFWTFKLGKLLFRDQRKIQQRPPPSKKIQNTWVFACKFLSMRFFTLLTQKLFVSYPYFWCRINKAILNIRLPISRITLFLHLCLNWWWFGWMTVMIMMMMVVLLMMVTMIVAFPSQKLLNLFKENRSSQENLKVKFQSQPFCAAATWK